MPRVILGIDPRNPTDYTGLQLNAVPTVQAARRPLVTDRLYPLQTIWRITRNPTTGAEGDEWMLVTFETNGDARWVMFMSGGSGAVTHLRADDNNVASPLAGIIDVDGNVVANGSFATPLFTTANIANTVDWNLQVSSAVAASPLDANDAGISSYDNTQFNVNTTTGFVQLAGGSGPATQSIDVDFFTAPGTDPVVPNAMGQIAILGNTVANATNLNSPIATHSRNANEFNIDIQVASAVAASPANAFDAGIASFDNTQFTVDPMTGFVQFVGGAGPAMQSFTVDANTAPGTNPVVPDAMGNVDILGATVANATNANSPVTTHSRAANAFNVEVQVASAVAPTPVDAFDAGLASFSSAEFTTDTSTGFTQLRFPSPPQLGATNLSFNYNSGTGVFTILGANNTNLSTTNPAYVTMNVDNGDVITIPVTANQDFIDSVGASEISGNLFGLTTGVGTNVNVPFYVYAVLNDAQDNIQFMISRTPTFTESPVVANIGAPDDPVANIQSAFWSLENIDETLYDTNPCLMIGTIEMRKTSGNDWTVQQFPSAWGVGRFSDVRFFTFPPGHFGAANGRVFANNGGTAPGFADVQYLYKIFARDQVVQIFCSLSNVNVAGGLAVTAQLALPFIKGPNSGTPIDLVNQCAFRDNTTGLTYSLRHARVNTGTSLCTFFPDGSATAMINTDFASQDELYVNFMYPISVNE